MDPTKLENMAEALRRAEESRESIAPLKETNPEFSIEDAYKVQMINMSKRLAGGATVVGKKVGLTSKPMQNFLGVDEPDFGHLFNDMLFDEETALNIEQFLQPKVEAELAFVLASDLQGPGVTVADVLRSTQAIVPAFEIIASRISNWKIKIEDTVADNGSSAGLIMGKTHSTPDAYDLSQAMLELKKNGSVIDSATGDAVMGHPAKAVAWLANALGKLGIPLRKGEIILSGSFTKAYEVAPGDVFSADFGPLGTVKAVFSK